jgi:CRAL/TRIO domain
MGQMFIVNAPMLFTGVWAVVKGFLDERTRNKIQIKGSKYQKELLELVEPQNLPDFIGGSCKCEKSGGCMLSVEGPWNDFELAKPWGIRHKVTGHLYNFEKKIE